MIGKSKYAQPKDRTPTEAFVRFQSALRLAMAVSKEELNERLARDRERMAQKPRRGPKPKNSKSCANEPTK